MPSRTSRIVVQTTPQEKRAIAAKAKGLGMSVSDLMRAGAGSFEPEPADPMALAQAAHAAMDRSMASFDETMQRIIESIKRIEAVEADAAWKRRVRAKNETATAPHGEVS